MLDFFNHLVDIAIDKKDPFESLLQKAFSVDLEKAPSSLHQQTSQLLNADLIPKKEAVAKPIAEPAAKQTSKMEVAPPSPKKKKQTNIMPIAQPVVSAPDTSPLGANATIKEKDEKIKQQAEMQSDQSAQLQPPSAKKNNKTNKPAATPESIVAEQPSEATDEIDPAKVDAANLKGKKLSEWYKKFDPDKEGNGTTDFDFGNNHVVSDTAQEKPLQEEKQKPEAELAKDSQHYRNKIESLYKTYDKDVKNRVQVTDFFKKNGAVGNMVSWLQMDSDGNLQLATGKIKKIDKKSPHVFVETHTGDENNVVELPWHRVLGMAKEEKAYPGVFGAPQEKQIREVVPVGTQKFIKHYQGFIANLMSLMDKYNETNQQEKLDSSENNNEETPEQFKFPISDAQKKQQATALPEKEPYLLPNLEDKENDLNYKNEAKKLIQQSGADFLDFTEDGEAQFKVKGKIFTLPLNSITTQNLKRIQAQQNNQTFVAESHWTNNAKINQETKNNLVELKKISDEGQNIPAKVLHAQHILLDTEEERSTSETLKAVQTIQNFLAKEDYSDKEEPSTNEDFLEKYELNPKDKNSIFEAEGRLHSLKKAPHYLIGKQTEFYDELKQYAQENGVKVPIIVQPHKGDQRKILNFLKLYLEEQARKKNPDAPKITTTMPSNPIVRNMEFLDSLSSVINKDKSVSPFYSRMIQETKNYLDSNTNIKAAEKNIGRLFDYVYKKREDDAPSNGVEMADIIEKNKEKLLNSGLSEDEYSALINDLTHEYDEDKIEQGLTSALKILDKNQIKVPQKVEKEILLDKKYKNIEDIFAQIEANKPQKYTPPKPTLEQVELKVHKQEQNVRTLYEILEDYEERDPFDPQKKNIEMQFRHNIDILNEERRRLAHLKGEEFKPVEYESPVEKKHKEKMEQEKQWKDKVKAEDRATVRNLVKIDQDALRDYLHSVNRTSMRWDKKTQKDIRLLDDIMLKKYTENDWTLLDPKMVDSEFGRAIIARINRDIERMQNDAKTYGVELSEIYKSLFLDNILGLIEAEKKLFRRDLSIVMKKSFIVSETNKDVNDYAKSLFVFGDDFIEKFFYNYKNIPLSAKKYAVRVLIKSLLHDCVKENSLVNMNMRPDYKTTMNDEIVKSIAREMAIYTENYILKEDKPRFFINVDELSENELRAYVNKSLNEDMNSFSRKLWVEKIKLLENKMFMKGLVDSINSDNKLQKFVEDNNISTVKNTYINNLLKIQEVVK